MAQETVSHRKTSITCAAVLILAGLQSIAALNPFYLVPKDEGKGYAIRRTQSGENVTSFYASKRQVSWRNLADAVENLQRDLGATLIITDSPETASAPELLPAAQSVRLRREPAGRDHAFRFLARLRPVGLAERLGDFHRSLDQPEHAGRSAVAGDHERLREGNAVEDPPLPGFDKSWDVWNCQNFVGAGGQAASPQEANTVHESEALPK